MSFFVLTEPCPYCQKQRNPRDILHLPGGVKICVECEHRHQEALRALSGEKFSGECSECGKRPDVEGPGPDFAMAVHYENGKYRLMCPKCNEIYVPKRRELYGGTEYGRARGL